MRVKIIAQRGSFEDLENDINKWLGEHEGVEIENMFYNDNNVYCSVLILYKTTRVVKG